MNTKIHPALFQSIFHPNGNELQTTKFRFTSYLSQVTHESNQLTESTEFNQFNKSKENNDAAPNLGDETQVISSTNSTIGRQFTFNNMVLVACNEEAFAEQSFQLKLESSCATLESDSFLYRGAIKNGCRHDNYAVMLAKGTSIELPVYRDAIRFQDPSLRNTSPFSSEMLVKIWSPFKDSAMDGENAIIEWYTNTQGIAINWEDLSHWWQQHMRYFANQTKSELDEIINQNLSNYQLVATYKGSLQQGLKHGNGTMKWIESGDRYKGEYHLGKRHGSGTMEWPSKAERYEGEWVDGLAHGTGSLYFFNIEAGTCNYYEGQFKNGMKDGRGTFYFADGTKFEGEWQNDMKNGYGNLYFLNGVIERGYYENDKKIKDVNAGTISINDEKTSKSRRPISRGSAAGSRALSARPSTSSARSTTSANTQKRALSRRSALLKNKRVAKEMQAVNNQQFDSIPFYIDDILMGADCDSSEVQALSSYLTRVAPKLQEIYNYYCLFGEKVEKVRVALSSSTSSVSVLGSSANSNGVTNVHKAQTVVSKHNDLSLHQFWKFSKECGLSKLPNLSLASIDRIFMKTSQIASRPDIRNAFDKSSIPRLSVLMKTSRSNNIHSPQNRIRFREFCETIFRISYATYNSYDKRHYIPLHLRFQQLLEEVVFPNYEQVDKNASRDSVFIRENPKYSPIILQYIDSLKSLFQDYATLQSNNIRDTSQYNENDATISVRQFLRMLDIQDFIGGSLTMFDIITLIDNSSENTPTSTLVVDRELIFEEFVEYLIQVGMKRFSTNTTFSTEECIKHTFEWLVEGNKFSLPATEEEAIEGGDANEDKETNPEVELDEEHGKNDISESID